VLIGLMLLRSAYTKGYADGLQHAIKCQDSWDKALSGIKAVE